MKNLKIILTGSGAPAWPYIFKNLKKNNERDIEIIGTDIQSRTAGSALAKKHYIVPKGSDPEYVKCLLKICKTEKPDIIFPVTDPELLPLAKNIDNFTELGVKVLVSNYSQLKIAGNKARLYEFLRKNNIPHPKMVVVNSLQEFKDAVYNLGYPKKPVCFKPGFAWGSRGFRVIREDVDRLQLLLNQKPDSTLITLNESINILEKAVDFPELIVMEYLPGDEYSVDMLLKNGESLLTVPRIRNIIKQGITFEGQISLNKEIIRISELIANKTKLDYNIGMQFKMSEKNEPMLLEINPRIQGTSVLLCGAGVNIPYMAIKLILDEEIPKLSVKDKIFMTRYWEEIFFDEGGSSYTL
ncbi:MAG: ATP-grasp domain-containing protein [Nanoarchaeota archaeon]